MERPLAYVVVLNYNAGAWLRACFEALAETRYPNLGILMVDNASTDSSLNIMAEHHPGIEVIRAGANLGFSEGNNIGIRRALDKGADYVVLLNPDTRVAPEWLDRMVEAGESDPRIGILGAVQLDYESEGFNSWTLSAFPGLIAELGDPEHAPEWIPVEWVEGACMAVKREVFDRIGMLDAIYFAFYEEIDFCRRAKVCGYEVALVPRSRIRHYRGGSWRANASISRERDYRCDRSQFIFNMTDPRRTALANIKQYLVTLGTKAKAVAAGASSLGPLDLCRMQFDLLTHGRAIYRKWRAERRGMAAGNVKL